MLFMNRVKKTFWVSKIYVKKQEYFFKANQSMLSVHIILYKCSACIGQLKSALIFRTYTEKYMYRFVCP